MKIGYLPDEQLNGVEIGKLEEYGIQKIKEPSEVDILLCFSDNSILRLPRKYSNIPQLFSIELPGDNSFFSEISFNKIEIAIQELQKGNFYTSKRSLMSIEFGSENLNALNDLYLASTTVNTRIRYEIFIDNNSIYNQPDLANSLLVSTPTGSTAMAMNLGGAFLHPSADVIQIQAIAPRNQVFKHQIVSAGSEIAIQVIDAVKPLFVQVDNQRIETEERNFRITRSTMSLEFINLNLNLNTIEEKLENKLSFEDTQNLSSSAKFILHVLSSENRSITINEIMEITHINNQKTVRSALKLLISKGFVLKKDNLEDLREHLYSYTEFK